MKILVMPEAGKIDIIDYEIPKIDTDEILVKIAVVGICTWEQKFYFGKSDGFPFVGGHEISGVIEKIGTKVNQDLSVGDKVVVASLTRCGECYYCRRGYDNQCENASDEDKLKGYRGPGGFAQYITAKGYEVYKLDNDVDLVTASIAEPLACVTHSLNISNIAASDSLLVCGGGFMGLLHVMLAQKRGAKIIVSEPNDIRRNKAIELGASFVINPLKQNLVEEIRNITNGRGVESAIYTAGGKNAIMDAIEVLTVRGTLVIYGATSSDDILSIDPKIFHYKEINLTGVTKHTKDTFRVASQIISDKSLPLRDIIGPVLPYTEIKEAFEKTKDPNSYRVVISF